MRLDRFIRFLEALIPHERENLGTVLPDLPQRTGHGAGAGASAAGPPRLRRSQLALVRRLYEYACQVCGSNGPLPTDPSPVLTRPFEPSSYAAAFAQGHAAAAAGGH